MTTYGGAVTRTAEGRWTAHGSVAHPDGTRTCTSTRSTTTTNGTTDGTSRAEVWAKLAQDLRAIATSTTSTTTRYTPSL